MAKELSTSLFTDLYELTMAQAYWKSGVTGDATFSLFIRRYPPDRAYFVFAGLEDILDYLESLRFTEGDIEHLSRLSDSSRTERSRSIFEDGFLDYLAGLRFTGSVRAMPEGSIFFTDEPVIEVSGPVIEAQLVETFLVNQANLQTILATKASRVIHAARGRTVVDFAARRTHGTEAASKLARASYMAGFASTSNVLAGGLYGIHISGTMAHSFVTAFEDETEAFRAYARAFPDSTTLLVDTYDTLEGVRKAIVVAREMKRRGHSLRAVRLDSGDLLDLSLKTRALLDDAGLPEAQVFASGGLDEFEVDELLKAGAPIDGFGVGTLVGVSADAPWTDCAYKLVEYDGRPALKLSSGKQTLPGPKQVYRFGEAHYQRDVIARASEAIEGATPLLAEVMRGGKRTAPSPTLKELRERFAREFARLPDRHKALRSPEPYNVSVSQDLEKLRSEVVKSIRAKRT